MADVKVILCQDAYHRIRPLEYKSGEKRDLGSETSLGWTLSMEHCLIRIQTL